MLMKCTHHSRVRQTMSWEMPRGMWGGQLVLPLCTMTQRARKKKSSEAIKIKEPRKEPTKQQTNSPFRWPQIKQFFIRQIYAAIFGFEIVCRLPSSSPFPHSLSGTTCGISIALRKLFHSIYILRFNALFIFSLWAGGLKGECGSEVGHLNFKLKIDFCQCCFRFCSAFCSLSLFDLLLSLFARIFCDWVGQVGRGADWRTIWVANGWGWGSHWTADG